MERTTQTMPWLLRRPFRIVSSVTTTLTPSSSITPIKGTRARSLAGMRTRARCFILDDTLRISGRRRLGWQQAHCISAIALVSCRWLFIGIPKALLCAVDRVSQAHYSNSAGTFFPYEALRSFSRSQFCYITPFMAAPHHMHLASDRMSHPASLTGIHISFLS